MEGIVPFFGKNTYICVFVEKSLHMYISLWQKENFHYFYYFNYHNKYF